MGAFLFAQCGRFFVRPLLILIMALVPLAPIARAPNVSTQPLATVRLQSAGPSQGMQMAEAIGQVGAVAANLQSKYAELTDTRNLIEAEEVMRAKTQEFNTWRRDPANADESQWLPKWQEMQNATQKHIDGLKITDRARLNLSRSFGQWADKQTISVQGDAFKNAGRRTGAALQLRIEQGEGLGDDGQIESSYGAAVKTGVMLPEEAELAKFHSLKRAKETRRSNTFMEIETLKKDAAATFEDVRQKVVESPDLTDTEKTSILVEAENQYAFQDMKNLIYENPTHGLEVAKNDLGRGAISQAQYNSLEVASQNRIVEFQRGEYAEIVDKMKGGKVKPDALRGMILDSARLSDGQKAELATILDGPTNDPQVYSSLMKEAANFEYDADSPQYAMFITRMQANLEGTHLSEAQAALKERVGATSDPYVRSKGAVYSTADDDLKAGMFGPLTGKLSDLKTKLPPKIQAQIDTLKDAQIKAEAEGRAKRHPDEPRRIDFIESKAREAWWNTQPEELRGASYENFEIEDLAKSREAGARQTEILQSLDKFKADNPKATAMELRQFYDSQVADLRKKAGLPPVASGGSSAIGTTLPTIDGVTSPSIDSIRKRHAQNPRK